MDIQKTAKTLIKYLGQNPELIKRFIEHPYSTTATAVGSDARISKKDMSEVLTATAAMSNNQKLSDVANIASALLSQNGNSVHSLASMLFGGGNTAHATQVAQQQTTPAGTLNLGTLVNMASLAATLMGGAAAATAQQPQAQPKPTVNLADGLDLGEVAILAGQFLSANNAAQQAQAQAQAQAAQPLVQLQTQAQPQAQQQKPGIDFATIAQLASVLLKQKG